MSYYNRFKRDLRIAMSILTLLFTKTMYCQTDVEGLVLDESGPLSAASIIVLNSSDSVMAGFAIANQQGKFKVEDLEVGHYIFQVSFLGYADEFIDVTLDGSTSKMKMEDVVMKPGSVKLDEVIISADHIPIRVSNDTIQYNAAAFNVAPNAVVEDLLRKLPGIEVQKDGTIKAQGETVQKVLVEGKEFFGSDPTIATKNLPASAVDKVEVFDKKSDMAEFSGIDDGNEQKTINLSLKADHKTGIFGNGSGGYGTEGRYSNKFNINSFSGDATWTALGLVNNTNEQGFSLMDYLDFMGGISAFSMGGGSMRINSDDIGLPIGQDLGQGFVSTASGGINYNHDLSKKTELSGSYFYSRLKRDIDRVATRQSILNQESFQSVENSIDENLSNRHTLNAKLKSKIDSFQRVNLRGNLGWNLVNNSSNLYRGLSTNDRIANELNNNTSSSGDQFRYGLNATYNRRFRKNGRVLSLNADIKDRNSTNETRLNAVNTLFPFGGMMIDTSIQRQFQENKGVDYSAALSFTEPLGKRRYLELNYSFQNVRNDFQKDFFDMKNGKPEEVYNELLSDLFERQFLYNRIGLKFKVNRKKYNYTVGLSLQHSDQSGRISSADQALERSYLSVLPSARLRYQIGGTTGLDFYYNTDINEPSLQQLQPQLDNSDPLYLYQGNPGLNPEYNHNVNVNYNTYNSFSQTSLFGGANIRYTTDKIRNAQFIDSRFVQTTKPINVDYDLNASVYLTFSTPIKPLKLKTEISTDIGLNKGLIFINELKNNTTNWANNYTITFENRAKKHVDWLIGSTVNFNARSYSENSAFNQNFLNYNYFADVSKKIGDKWYIKTSFDYKKWSEEMFGSATDLAVWKASVSMNFLKGNRGQLILSVVDILNQNKGINRTTQLNYFEDERIISLGRYAMLSFGYSFAGFGNKESAIQVTSRRR